MTAITKPKPGWQPPEDLDVLEPTPELLALRKARALADEAFEQARAQVGELLEERDELERRVLDGDTNAGQPLAELNIRIALAPKQVAITADELAAATIDWARYVQDAAEEARLEALRAEKELNRANRLVGPEALRLYRGPKEIPGARQEIERGLAESQPLRDRQQQAARLKSRALSQLKRLLGVRGNGRFGRPEIAQARRRFVERTRAEAAELVMSR